MNRLQKKCLIATAGTHLFLLVLLLCSGFFKPRPKMDDTQVLDVIPANAVDAAFTSGIKAAQPPAPTPVVTPPPPQPIPTPPQPQPMVTPPPPTSAPSLMQKMENLFKPAPEKLAPDELKPVEETSKPKEHKINVDLTPVAHRPSENSPAKNDSRKQERERERELARALRNLKNNLSTATEVNMPGNSSVAYANYGAIVVSVYHQAFRPPDNMNNANATVTFKVTVARDGSVISSRIVTSSGDASVDDAVQRMLDRVTFIEAFPDDSKDTERNYTIDFDATRTSLQ
jgi:TonB family protein